MQEQLITVSMVLYMRPIDRQHFVQLINDDNNELIEISEKHCEELSELFNVEIVVQKQ